MRDFLSKAVIVICAAAMIFSIYKLYNIYLDYKEIGEIYDCIEAQYTTKNAETKPEEKPEEVKKEEPVDDNADGYYEDAEPPLTVDWDALREESNVVGWVYIDAFETSYPIAQADDNDYYLHRTLSGNYLFAGTIFLSCNNHPDFSDANSIVYGHNMNDGSMFGQNKKLKDQETYDENPYFWILTPEGNYRYHIYSVTTVYPETDPYIIWEEGNCPEFLEWEKALQEASIVENDVLLKETDHTVILSCCEPNHKQRTLVVGRCCSRQQPPSNYNRQEETNEH